jgi:hypothetical protein
MPFSLSAVEMPGAPKLWPGCVALPTRGKRKMKSDRKVPTDVENLGWAMAYLEQEGILTPSWDSLVNPPFTRRKYERYVESLKCCGSCIASEVIDDWKENERIHDGYALFSAQDAGAFDEKGKLKQRLFLCFGNFRDKSNKGQLAIARRLVEIFKKSFTVEWSGRLSEKLCIVPRSCKTNADSLEPSKHIGPGIWVCSKIQHFRMGTQVGQ